MDHEATRNLMAVESHQREHIEGKKKAIHERETDILQAELDLLEAKNSKLTQQARSMALSQQEDSLDKKAARYKAQKNEDIFGDADCVQSAPIRQAAPQKETSRNNNVAPVQNTKPAEEDEEEDGQDSDEPKTYEVVEDDEVEN